MIITCWSVKGGSGTTVVAATLALVTAKRSPTLLVDLAGDIPAALGLPESAGPGVYDWLESGGDRRTLKALERVGGVSLGVLHAGIPTAASGEPLADALAADGRAVVVDAGVVRAGAPFDLASAATTSLLVLRPCYLALRRAAAAPLRPSGVVFVNEPGRSLSRRDVESVLGVPVVAEVDMDPAVARAVDAGLLACRLPRLLERSLKGAA